jgi:hypothetical protein
LINTVPAGSGEVTAAFKFIGESVALVTAFDGVPTHFLLFVMRNLLHGHFSRKWIWRGDLTTWRAKSSHNIFMLPSTVLYEWLLRVFSTQVRDKESKFRLCELHTKRMTSRLTKFEKNSTVVETCCVKE